MAVDDDDERSIFVMSTSTLLFAREMRIEAEMSIASIHLSAVIDDQLLLLSISSLPGHLVMVVERRMVRVGLRTLVYGLLVRSCPYLRILCGGAVSAENSGKKVWR
jgi:hypothetical protein